MYVAYVGVVVVQQLGSGTLANMRRIGQVAESARYVLEAAGGVQPIRILVKESENVGGIGVVVGVSRIVVKVVAALEVEAYLPELEERMVVLVVLVRCLKVAERAAR